MEYGGESDIDPVKEKESLIAKSYTIEKRAGVQRELSEVERNAFSTTRVNLRRARESIAGEFGKRPKYKLARDLLKGAR